MVAPSFGAPACAYYGDAGCSSGASARSPCNFGSNSDTFDQLPKQYFCAPQVAVQPVAYPRSLFAGDSAQPTSDPQSNGASGQASTTSSLGAPQAFTQAFGASKPVFGAPPASTEDFGTPAASGQYFCAPPASSQVFGASQASKQVSFSQVFGASQASKLVFGATPSFGCTSSFEGYRQPFVDNQLVGSRVIPYSPTAEEERISTGVPSKFTSISAMKEYSNKSHEELRLEDYQQKRNKATSLVSDGSNLKLWSSSWQAPYHPAPAVGNSRNMFTFSPQPSSCPAPVFGAISMNTPAVGNSRNMFTFPPQPSSCPAPPASVPTSIDQLQESLPKQMEAGNSPCVPKGLEIIVEKLGINPWLQGKDNVNKDNDPIVGSILRCDKADKDADIISLAMFAVEQHNALYEGDHYTFVKVVVACLEPIQGGRYHIVLDTKFRGPGFKPPVRHYAVVLRKCTQSAIQMTVLEKWLSSTTVIPPSLPL